MANQDNAALLKEQLRLKSLELKKRDMEKSKHEAKIKHILTLNQKTIEDLKTEIVKKEEEHRFHLETSRHSSPGIETRSPAEFREPAVEVREVMVQDPGMMDTIAELRQKNSELTTQINLELGEKGRLSKERGLLLKEIKRLRETPESPEKLKQKVAALETRAQEVQRRYEQLLQEKNSLSKAFEETALKGFQGSFEEGEFSPDNFLKLKDELHGMKKENEEMENKLIQAQKKFTTDIHKQINDMEDEWQKKLKKAKMAKDKGPSNEDIVEDESAPIWMITFADMSALLLACFVLLYSINAMNIGKFKEAILGEEAPTVQMMELLNTAELKRRISELTGIKSKDILTEVTQIAEDSQISVSKDQAKIVLRVPGQTLFPAGSANLQKEARPILDDLIKVTKRYPEYKVNIQGHTDDTSIATEQFPTNWELSAARATAVLRYFIDKGLEPTRMTATGYADIFPIASNDTEQGKAQNRRVEIVLEKEKK